MDDAWRELLALLAGVAASVFGLMRLSLTQHKSLTDRFVSALEDTLKRQAGAIDRFSDSVHELTGGVRESSRLVRSLAERLRVALPVEGDGQSERGDRKPSP